MTGRISTQTGGRRDYDGGATDRQADRNIRYGYGMQ